MSWEPIRSNNLPDSEARVALVHRGIGWQSIAFGFLDVSDDSEGLGVPYWETTVGQQSIDAFTHYMLLEPLPEGGAP